MILDVFLDVGDRLIESVDGLVEFRDCLSQLNDRSDDRRDETDESYNAQYDLPCHA